MYYLQIDSRISLTQISIYVNLTPAAVKYRLQKLVSNNVIKRFTTVINYQKLTPNYQAYLIQASIDTENYSIIADTIQKTGMLIQSMRIASNINFIGTTKPISSKDIRILTNIFTDKSVYKFIATPIVEDLLEETNHEIIAENISKLYCPQCQDHFDGKAIVTEVSENQVMGFCCKECKSDFMKNLKKIIQIE